MNAPLLCLISLSAYAKDWVDIKDPAELTALFSDKTFKGSDWIAYYRADGTGILVRDGGQPIPRKWEVKGDQVCFAGDPTFLISERRFQRHRKNRNEIAMTNLLSNMTYIVRVKDGIPK